MEESTWWWILAGITIAAELLTGGIYLLMIALGLACGAIAAHLGLSAPLQISAAALVGVLAVLVCRRIRGRRQPELPASANPDLNLDIGETLHVPEWNSDGTARIPYRGSQWTVSLRPGSMPTAGLYRVIEVQGNRLIVDKA
ncbi:NfeD family protein [Comamonas sp. NoAH]|uniref:NfeD family protein n=1 Tax=Comamonas halotolerans TaxID=3041496 RepID=UPI0024E0E1DD|nr:NfeD family protein [Comamonas sp. NoAH]